MVGSPEEEVLGEEREIVRESTNEEASEGEPKMRRSLSSDGVRETGFASSSCSGRGINGGGGVNFFVALI